jgi:hypothetical protein
MPWIDTVGVDQARGRLARSYRAALERAGRVSGIVQVQSLAPAVLDASIGLYQRILFADQGLGRYQREMLAVVVSRANHCHY